MEPNDRIAADNPGCAILLDGPTHFSTGAVIVGPDSRYLLQLRDNRPDLLAGGHWAVFGGMLEENENPRDALLRELAEELEFVPQSVRWLSEIVFNPPASRVSAHHKTFFEISVTREETERMVQHEGKDMRFVTIAEAAGLLIVPWDAYGIYLHSCRQTWREIHDHRLKNGIFSPYADWIA